MVRRSLVCWSCGLIVNITHTYLGALCSLCMCVATPLQEGCGFHPRGVNTQVYKLAYHHGDLCLSGTAEVPLAGQQDHLPSPSPHPHVHMQCQVLYVLSLCVCVLLHTYTGMLMERCIPLEALPLRLVAFGRCFRAEDGESFLTSGGSMHLMYSTLSIANSVDACRYVDVYIVFFG